MVIRDNNSVKITYFLHNKVNSYIKSRIKKKIYIVKNKRNFSLLIKVNICWE